MAHSSLLLGGKASYFALILAIVLLSCSTDASSGAVPGPKSEIWRLAEKHQDWPGLGNPLESAKYCGQIGYIGFNPELDGPEYYFSRSDGRVIARCGGYCEADPESCIRNCPPKEWKCR